MWGKNAYKCIWGLKNQYLQRKLPKNVGKKCL